MAFQSEAHVEKRTIQKIPVLRQQRQDQPPHTPIAIEKGVNGFELNVGQPGFDKRMKLIAGMNPIVEIGKQSWYG